MICPNGVMCFGRRFEGYTIPSVNRAVNAGFHRTFCLTPYFTDLIPTNNGEITYHVYDFTDVGTQVDGVYDTVVGLVGNAYNLTDFDAVFVLKVTWANVTKYDGTNSERATFQSIYVTDGVRAYAFYSYKDGGMTFMSGSQFIGLIVDGYAEGEDNTADGSYLRQPDQNLIFKNICRGATSYDLNIDETEARQNYKVQCRSWRKKETSRRQLYLARYIRMPWCPCNLWWTWWDRQFSLIDSTFDGDIISVPLVHSARYSTHGKTCAYDVNTFQFIPTGLHAGTFQRYNRLAYPRDHALEDTQFQEICCQRAGLCNLYWQVRPLSSQCYSAFPFSLRAFGVGDPHITTIDGVKYTFNGHGEYVLTRVVDEENKTFEIQCRTSRATRPDGAFSQATVFSGFAVKGDNVWFQVELNGTEDGMAVYFGTSPTDFADVTSDYYDLTSNMRVEIGDLTVSRDNSENTVSAVFGDTGIIFNVTMGVRLLQMSIAMPNTLKDRGAVGLLGNFNENQGDEYIPRNQTTSLTNPTNRVIFNEFGKTWMTSEQESIFKYDDGVSHADFSFPNFEPEYLDEVDAANVSQANVTCNGNLQCMFDLIFTGNEALAAQTGSTEDAAEATNTQASNQIPTINADFGTSTINDQIYVYSTLNQQTTFGVQGVDPGDTLNYLFVDNTVNAMFGPQNPDSPVNVSFTLTDTNPGNVSVAVVDAHNVRSPEFDVVIVLCTGCRDHGACNSSLVREGGTDSFKYATCLCEVYWTVGRDCSDVAATDHKANPSLKAYTCSPCPDGYLDVDDKCLDVNECTTANPCSSNSVCVNTEGSYRCDCNAGFRLSSTDRNVCNDIDECSESTSGCAQICTNTAGGFNCSCVPGYTLDADEKACTQDAVPAAGCNITNCSRAEGCTLVNDTATCFCAAGYQLQQDNSCTACTFPSYGTNCARTCQCGRGSLRCDPVRGCVCKAGWTGVNCDTDIVECVTPNVCNDVNKVCTNTIGSYTCTCRQGYTNENGVCVDFDECTAGVSGCEQKCQNSVGRFSCECFFGYRLNADRKTCIEVENVCATEFPDNGCSQICRADLQTQTYECRCNTGFQLGADQKTCIDLNECTSATLNLCTQTCLNNDGGYVCQCETGFKLENDARTCAICDAYHYGDNCALGCNCGVGAERCDHKTGCVCKSGWTGEKCGADQDECATGSDDCNGNNEICVNTPGSFQCECESGYERDGSNNCVDVNECTAGTGECAQSCTNTPGGYACSCNPGFVASGNACNDINECDGVNNCSQVCENTVGGYRCSCKPGFVLDTSDRRTCLISEVCQTNPCNANADCAVVGGVETCVCKAGFTFSTNSNTSCEDILECGQTTAVCSQGCAELAGGYACYCDQDGFQLDADLKTCIDCDAGYWGGNCSETCTCITANSKACNRTNGICTCKSGWEGSTCESDINECDNSSVCPDNSQCRNTNGSFECNCNSGYVATADGTCQGWSGPTCDTDDNECSKPDICEDKCTNIAGSFECGCFAGFSGTNNSCTHCDAGYWGGNCSETCTCITANSKACNRTNGICTCKSGWEGSTCESDINECDNSSVCPDNSQCRNTNGSFECNCNSGYVATADGTCQGWSGPTCDTDDNECSKPDICEDVLKTCTNTAGSYTCDCAAGYTINSDGVCVDEDECLLGTDNCLQKCTNIAGSFECGCFAGFSGTNNSCTQCTNNTYGVQCNMTCTCEAANMDRCDPLTGCVCSAGWEGVDCATDVNECALNTDNCTQDSTCTNTDGSFECPCNSGFFSSNGLCEACTGNTFGDNCTSSCDCVGNNTFDTSQSCNHVTGICECNEFWNGSRCEVDIDECAMETDTCVQNCTNIPGYFECGCFAGYSGTNNSCTRKNYFVEKSLKIIYGNHICLGIKNDV
ncbi:MLP-like protein [Mya arenaria]|uniref:MLP-like protein n=1 Tax=Mya arenaria TaxID=6604 RepID=A0ABY7E729_MYAAR|nr:MLP-like protein [Mya arenaria]